MEDDRLHMNRNVGLFFLLTFLFSWLLWLPFVLDGFKLIRLSENIKSLMTLAVAIGAFGPMISALILIGYKEKWIGIKRFFRQTLSWKVGLKYYLFALFIPLLTAAFAHYFVNVLGIDILPSNLFPEDLSVPVIALIIPYFIAILLFGGGQEEFGWRGYAQEPLQERFGILKASIFIGVVWAVWHLPLWFMPGEGHTYYSFFAFCIYTISFSVIIGWLYNASGKKMVIPWFMHAMGNVSVPFFPVLHLAKVPQPGYWVWAFINVLVAIGLSVWYRDKNFNNS